MTALWKCDECDKLNLPTNDNCASCSYKPDNIFSSCLKSIEVKQSLLFHGYLRINIQNNNKPTDIITLCLRFYLVDLKLSNPKSSKDEQSDELWRMADEFYNHRENFIAYNIFDCVKHNFNDGYCEWKMAEILNRWKEYDSSEIYYKKAMTATEATHYLEIKYIWRFGSSLTRQSKYKLALPQLQEAYKRSKQQQGHDVWIKKLFLKSMDSLAACYKRMDNFENAAEIYLELTERDPENAKAKYLYTGVLRWDKKFDQALKYAVKVFTDSQGTNAEMALEIAWCHEALKDHKRAEEYYLKAIELNNGKKSGFCSAYADFLRDIIGNHEKAQTYYQKAIGIEPNNYDHYYNVADCHKRMKDYENAEKIYLELAEKNQNSAGAYYNIAKMCRDNVKDYDKSQKYYLKCLEMKDPNYGANGSYGYLLYLMGEYHRAMKHIGIQLVINEKNKWAHFYKSLVYAETGDDGLSEISLWQALTYCKEQDFEGDLKYIEQVMENNEYNEIVQKYKGMLCKKMKLSKRIICQLI